MAVAASPTLGPSASPALGPKPEPQLVVRNTFLELFEDTPLTEVQPGRRPRGFSDMTHLRAPEKVQYVPRGLQLGQGDASGSKSEGTKVQTLPAASAATATLLPVSEGSTQGWTTRVPMHQVVTTQSGAQHWAPMPSSAPTAVPLAQAQAMQAHSAGTPGAWGYNTYAAPAPASSPYAVSSQPVQLAAVTQRMVAMAPRGTAQVSAVYTSPAATISAAASAAATLAAPLTPVPGEPTTVMLRNIPNRYTQNMLVELLDQSGFRGLYDFVYLPMDFRNGVNLGYAFVNLLNHHEALKAMNCFQGFSQWFFDSAKVCEVSWAHPHQGLDEHVERYRNSPVMHASMPDEYKPMIFNKGVRVQFPPPTKIIRAPKLRPVRDRAQNADGGPVSPSGA